MGSGEGGDTARSMLSTTVWPRWRGPGTPGTIWRPMGGAWWFLLPGTQHRHSPWRVSLLRFAGTRRGAPGVKLGPASSSPCWRVSLGPWSLIWKVPVAAASLVPTLSPRCLCKGQEVGRTERERDRLGAERRGAEEGREGRRAVTSGAQSPSGGCPRKWGRDRGADTQQRRLFPCLTHASHSGLGKRQSLLRGP